MRNISPSNLIIIACLAAVAFKVQRAYQVMSFRFSHERLTIPAVVELYNQKVSVSSGEAVTQDFVYAAQQCYQHIFSKPALANAILWAVHLQ